MFIFAKKNNFKINIIFFAQNYKSKQKGREISFQHTVENN